MTPEQRADQMTEQHGAALSKLGLRLEALRNGRAPLSQRYIRLREIADECGAMIAPLTPCGKGCSHCCHIATAITEHEAKIIARATGRKMAAVPHEHNPTTRLGANVKRFYGVACPFLRDNECSIYNVRPIQCRVHHSLADDAEPCRTGAGRGEYRIPEFNLRPLTNTVAAMQLRGRFGDIREFFP